MYIKRMISKGEHNIRDYNTETYYSFYCYTTGTGIFYTALKNTCERHNLINAIYEYVCNLEWFDSDIFEGDLVYLMVERGVIEEGEPTESDNGEHDDIKNKARYIMKKYLKGYNVVRPGVWFDDKKDILEDIYSDGEWELKWLD